MSVALRVLDDGAWLSVNDRRCVSVGELWRLADSTFCGCELPDVVVEGFQAVGVDGPTVAVRVYGQCIACGADGETDWVPVGRVSDGEWTDFDRDSILVPAGTKPPDSTSENRADADGARTAGGVSK